MLSESDKKEYMEIMHEFSAVRSELEAALYPADNSRTESDQKSSQLTQSAVSEPTGTSSADDMAQTDAERLAALRNELNV